MLDSIDQYTYKHFWKKSRIQIEFWEFYGDKKAIEKQGIVGQAVGKRKLEFNSIQERNVYLNSRMQNLARNGYEEIGDYDFTVLFIQIQYSKEDLQNQEKAIEMFFNLSSLKEEFELKIDEILSKNSLGGVFASDMGYGGNILCEVYEGKVSFNRIVEELKKEGLSDRTLIAKRICLGEDDWTYEVIYPIDFSGEFYSY